MSGKSLIVLAAILAAIGVAVGAFGAARIAKPPGKTRLRGNDDRKARSELKHGRAVSHVSCARHSRDRHPAIAPRVANRHGRQHRISARNRPLFRQPLRLVPHVEPSRGDGRSDRWDVLHPGLDPIGNQRLAIH